MASNKSKNKLIAIIDNPEIGIEDFSDLADYLSATDINLFNVLLSNDALSQEIDDYIMEKNAVE
ncbi:MAG: hypothetical protein Q4C42_05045 [Clostridia bacterium]|nr:hypothetical protein [Clostridia bacterium]